MRVFVKAEEVVKAAEELKKCGHRMPSHYCFDGEVLSPDPQASGADPKVYQRTPGGGKIRVAAVVCTECGHENEMKDMEFEPG